MATVLDILLSKMGFQVASTYVSDIVSMPTLVDPESMEGCVQTWITHVFANIVQDRITNKKKKTCEQQELGSG